jgi:hypothetical protein
VVQQRICAVAGTPGRGGIHIGDPSDSFEKAAEHNANLVMSPDALHMPSCATTTVPAVQRAAKPPEEQAEEPLHRMVQPQAMVED